MVARLPKPDTPPSKSPEREPGGREEGERGVWWVGSWEAVADWAGVGRGEDKVDEVGPHSSAVVEWVG